MENIRVIALDICGTVLCADDAENIMPPRNELKSFFDRCDSKYIKIVGSSDMLVESVKFDLEECFGNHPESGMSLDRFADFIMLNQLPRKDFSIIYSKFNVLPRELLVIGDNPIKDIGGARKYGCPYILVPKYVGHGDNFDFSKIII
ncbi:MAG: HAD hydrolase-like protein [archaeon]